MDKPLQELINELDKTGVLSDSFRKVIVAYGYAIAQDAYDRGFKKGKEKS